MMRRLGTMRDIVTGITLNAALENRSASDDVWPQP